MTERRRPLPNSTITWNGVSSDTLGIRIERFPNIIRASRKFEHVSVPGRNGDLFFFQDAYNNYTQDYEIFAGDGTRGNVETAFNDIVTWLFPQKAAPTISDYIKMTRNGYFQLIDSYEPSCIRLATFYNGAEITNSWSRYGRTILSFNCRPERFTLDAFKSIIQNLSDSVTEITLTNPTIFNAKPILSLPAFLGGTIDFNGDSTITITENLKASGQLYLDCESQNCFGDNLENYNNRVTVTNGFPQLIPGANTITLTTVKEGRLPQSIFIYPRWWTL